jgi:phenylacetate-coenzyme A ligase PaaK-like adenylate-forming protein
MELIDIETQTPITTPYTPGELVLTTLFERNPLPIIRYRTGDMAQWTDHHCTCSPEIPTLELLGRVQFDRVFLKRGMLLGGELERAMQPFINEIYDDFELHIHHTKEGDTITVYVRQKHPSNLEEMAARLAGTLRVSGTSTLQHLKEAGLIASITCVSMPPEKVLGRRVTRIVDHRM